MTVTTGLGAPIHRSLFSMGALFATVPSRTTIDAAIRPTWPQAARGSGNRRPGEHKVARLAYDMIVQTAAGKLRLLLAIATPSEGRDAGHHVPHVDLA